MNASALDVIIFLAVAIVAVASYGLIDAYRREETEAVSIVISGNGDDEILRGARQASRDLKIPLIISEDAGDVSFDGRSGAKHDVYAKTNPNEAASPFAAGYIAVLSAKTTILAPFSPKTDSSPAIDEAKNTAKEYSRVHFNDKI